MFSSKKVDTATQSYINLQIDVSYEDESILNQDKQDRVWKTNRIENKSNQQISSLVSMVHAGKQSG